MIHFKVIFCSFKVSAQYHRHLGSAWTWNNLMIAKRHLELNTTHAKIERWTDVCYRKHVFVLVSLVHFLWLHPPNCQRPFLFWSLRDHKINCLREASIYKKKNHLTTQIARFLNGNPDWFRSACLYLKKIIIHHPYNKVKWFLRINMIWKSNILLTNKNKRSPHK